MSLVLILVGNQGVAAVAAVASELGVLNIGVGSERLRRHQALHRDTARGTDCARRHPRRAASSRREAPGG